MAPHPKRVIEILAENKLVPLFFDADAQLSVAVLDACYKGGIRVFEYTNRGAAAKENFAILVAYIKENCPGMLLGIGTILNAEDCAAYIALGADFIVTPNLDEAVGAVCIEKNIAWIPGVITPTEIQKAYNLGAVGQKLFPGDLLSPTYVKSVRGPLPHTNLMVTGGVQPIAASIKPWLDAGAVCVGLGSQLFNKDMLATGDFKALEAKVRALVAEIL